MANETLVVPEEHLQEVIKVIRAGLNVVGKIVCKEVNKQLNQWCNEEQKYLRKN